MDFKFGHTYIKPIRLLPNFGLQQDNLRLVFKIPVGNIPDNEIDDYIRLVSDRFRSNSHIVYSNSGQLNSRDYFIPTRQRNSDVPDVVIIDHLSLLNP